MPITLSPLMCGVFVIILEIFKIVYKRKESPIAWERSKKYFDGKKKYMNGDCLTAKACLLEFLDSKPEFWGLIPMCTRCLSFKPLGRLQFSEISERLEVRHLIFWELICILGIGKFPE
jgi:hypothetical protein